CQIQTYASRQIVESGLEEIIALGRRLGVMGIYILFPIAAGRWDGAFDEVLTEKERARVRELQDLTRVHLELPTPETLCCLFTRSILYVSAQGDVSPCPFMPYRLGNIKEHSMKDLWQVHCKGLSLELKGNCPLNVAQYREAIEKHIDAVRLSFTYSDSESGNGNPKEPGGAAGERPKA
ncbi:MAG: SPASM domain-containing protein, partial [Candidatus Aminicenantes bacterium]